MPQEKLNSQLLEMGTIRRHPLFCVLLCAATNTLYIKPFTPHHWLL